MKRFVVWYDSRSQIVRTLLGSLAIAVPFYCSGLLQHSIGQVAKTGGVYPLAAHATVLIVLVTIVVTMARVVSLVRESLYQEEQARRTALMRAYAYTDRLICMRLADARRTPIEKSTFIDVLCTSRDSIQRLVEAAYSTFEAAFGAGMTSDERIDFEVTFMTRSYDDGEITIPACANREGRTPRSMVFRQDNQKIYDNTVTAQIYREARPSIHVVENTDEPDYDELYPGQKARIRSSIVFPVLSDTNELFGTLVVHCDRPGYFRRHDSKYWTDMLEIFAKRIALDKARMDVLWKIKSNGPEHLGRLVPHAWF
jgi:GAF domain-containing protein